MWSSSQRRRFAVASKLLAVLLGMLLGLSVVSGGAQTAVGPIGDQAHKQDVPGQPPLRLFDTELQKQDSGDDDRALGVDGAELSTATFELGGTQGWVTFADRRSGAAQRVREGNGARGPPIA